MFSQASPGSEAEPSIRKRLYLLFIIAPSLRIELQRIFEVLLVVMIRQQFHLQADSFQDRNVIDCRILDRFSAEDASGWAIHSSGLQLHPFEVLDLAQIGKCHIFLIFYVLQYLLSQFCLDFRMLADVVHQHVRE